MGGLTIAMIVIAGCNSSGTNGPDIKKTDGSAVDKKVVAPEIIGKKGSALTRAACVPPTSNIVINEIMADPDSPITDAKGEWFEVYNPHGYDIDMFNWTIKDDGSDYHQITAHLTVPAGGYAVLCRNGDSATNGGVTCDYTYSGFIMTNSGDQIVLDDNTGTEVDRVAWTKDAPTGASMELKNPVKDNKIVNVPASPNDPNAWTGSPFGLATTVYGGSSQNGTPGAKNDDYAEQDFTGCDDGNICTWDVCKEDKCDNSGWKDGCCLADADCNDGDVCTTDTCDTTANTCVHTAVANCCKNNAECQGWDENPCNYDYCAGSNHCRSGSSITPGCCWAPAANNPDTGEPWADQQTKQSWADSQCNDKNPCTVQACDLTANQCVVTSHVSGCCLINSDCNDSDVCTRDVCENHQCVNPKIDNCCHNASECDDNNICTDDRCDWNYCRHFLALNHICCATASDCNANANPCIETKCIGGRCKDIPKNVCNIRIPYKETFNNAEDYQLIGYKVIDYGTKSTDHWVITGTPNTYDLGPDKFAKFKWNPSIYNVKSVLAGPVLDCTPSNNSWNGSKQTTLEWTQSYHHTDPAGSAVLKVVVSQDGDFENGVILWQKTVTDDLPFTIEKAPLPANMKYSNHVQIGFFVQTADTFYMDSWHIDDVILSPGTPNYVWHSWVRECPVGDNLCRASQPVAEDTTPNEILDIGMYVNQFYRIWVDVQDPDYQGGTIYFSPIGGFLGAPFDAPSFVYPTVNIDGNQATGGCFKLSTYLHVFRCMFDVNPQGLQSNAGDYKLGYLVLDDNKGGVFSLHQSLNTINLTVLGLNGYLVWSPDDVDPAEADKIVTAIRANNRSAQKIRKLSIVPNFDHVRGLFINLGVHGQEHLLTTAEAQELADYLDHGGHIYLEGGDFWWTTDLGGNQPKTVLHDYFKTKAISDGTAKLTGPLTGSNFLYHYDYDYSNNYTVNTWLDQIKHKPGQGGREIMRKTGSSPFATQVAWDGGPTGYRTIASSTFFGGFVAQSGGKTTNELMERYLFFLENGYPPCHENAQCDDFEPCTNDVCTGGTVTNPGTCRNNDIPGCIPCMNDVYKEDGNLSCSTDQACLVAKGYCVDITPNEVKGTPDSSQESLHFGSMQAQVQSKIHVSQPGLLTDMQVKVNITHTYRGDVSLQLKHAGASVNLLNETPTDSRENIYETYDIGVPISTGDSLDTFNNKSIQGDWYLVATDNEPQVDNGILNTWSVYASYMAQACTTDAGCDDSNLCTADSCVNQECQNIGKDCDDGIDSTLDSCDPATGNCIHTPTDHCPSCPCQYHSDCGYNDVCLDNGVVCDPNNAANCQCEPIPGTIFDADTDNNLPKAIPDDDPKGLVLTRVIAPGENAAAAQVVKRLRVKVVIRHTSISDLQVKLCKDDTGTCVTLHNYTGGQNLGFYDVYDYDSVNGPGGLTDFKGQAIAGTWKLYVIDNVPTHFGTVEHWSLYIVPTQCYTDADCDDSSKCTVDTCTVSNDEGTCTHQAITCQQPSNLCQVNQCDPATGHCAQGNKPDNSSCDDGLYCTTDDYCKSGQCQAGDPRDCSAQDGQCVVGQCDEASQSCVAVNKGDGTACDDGEPCTEGDQCQAGVCQSGSTMVCDCTNDTDCTDDGARCNGVIGKCDLTTHKCTFVDGKGPVVCPPDPSECKKYQCAEPDGSCQVRNKNDYTTCDDGLYCTVSDRCMNGACEGGGARDCSSLDTQCATGVCDDNLDACTTQNVADGTDCEEDGEGCTIDQCTNGICGYARARDCSASAYECHYAFCQNVGWGGYVCKTQQMSDGSSCTDDGKPCTDDSCESGSCIHAQKEHCGAKCAGAHQYDAGDDQCGYEDSCVDGINGKDSSGNPLGQCTPTCSGTNCVEADSGLIDLPISEDNPPNGCTQSTVTISNALQFVSQARVKIDLDHQRLADLKVYVKDPQSYEYILWNHIGGSNANYANTFDFSFPIPYQYGGNPPDMDSAEPMCRISGDTTAGNWTLFVCDTGNQFTGVLHQWKLYLRGSATQPNNGKRCENAIVIPGADGTNTYAWNTMCAINNLQGPCGGIQGVERVYKVQINVRKHITVVAPQDVLNAAIYVLPEANGTCDRSKAEMCVDSNSTVGQFQKETWDYQIDAGTYYFVVDTDGNRYDYDTNQSKAITFTVKTPAPDGDPCIANLDCISTHCANGYCCGHGDCCPGGAWTQSGQDPAPLANDSDWQSAKNVCPASYKEVGNCKDTGKCQGHRWDANCVNHICEKAEVQDDAFCTTSVDANDCGPYVSVYCTGAGLQSPPQCLTACTGDTDCDAQYHCDPTEGATLPDSQSTHLICTADLPDGSASNEDSDCTSSHSANGYCCASGDCCSGDAATCPAAYYTAPACSDQAQCIGQRTDKTCVNYQCGSNTVRDDCACTGEQAGQCGLYIPVWCGCENTYPDGTCAYADTTSCEKANPATFDFGGPPACLTNCGTPANQHDNWCIDAAHCDPAPNNSSIATCQADLRNGSSCNENTDCISNHCQNNYCCNSGNCCSGDAVTCPANYTSAPVCDDDPTCQGHRVDAVCDTTNNNYQCGSTNVDDDTACDTGTFAQACGYFKDIYCDGAQDQAPPVCPTTCAADTECDNPGAHCDPSECAIDDGACMLDQQSTALVCKPDLINDKTCNETSDCTTAYCQIGFCCDVVGCCKGCKVTSFMPNLGGGGTDGLSSPSGKRVQSTAGQAGPGGHVEQSGPQASGVQTTDFGFYPAAAVEKLQ